MGRANPVNATAKSPWHWFRGTVLKGGLRLYCLGVALDALTVAVYDGAT